MRRRKLIEAERTCSRMARESHLVGVTFFRNMKNGRKFSLFPRPFFCIFMYLPKGLLAVDCPDRKARRTTSSITHTLFVDGRSLF